MSPSCSSPLWLSLSRTEERLLASSASFCRRCTSWSQNTCSSLADRLTTDFCMRSCSSRCRLRMGALASTSCTMSSRYLLTRLFSSRSNCSCSWLSTYAVYSCRTHSHASESTNEPLSLALDSSSLASSSSFSRARTLSVSAATLWSVAPFISCSVSSRALLALVQLLHGAAQLGTLCLRIRRRSLKAPRQQKDGVNLEIRLHFSSRSSLPFCRERASSSSLFACSSRLSQVVWLFSSSFSWFIRFSLYCKPPAPHLATRVTGCTGHAGAV
ncbi:hypothetical protein EYF80_054194 [Liparis tanakae]|uniref:Uncharacterized protein n=1 Tax=Liparis tanakae TaxID=230148 RepID=A0A4Z2F3L9_9TELE|nr:hypothetical protein EYF80_054194 [Liparis tanakae]